MLITELLCCRVGVTLLREALVYFKGYTVKGAGREVRGRWEPGGLRHLHLLKKRAREAKTHALHDLDF